MEKGSVMIKRPDPGLRQDGFMGGWDDKGEKPFVKGEVNIGEFHPRLDLKSIKRRYFCGFPLGGGNDKGERGLG
jgi:hypothetical protein